MDGRVRSSGQGLLLDLVLGVLGAVVSGYLFTAIGATGLTGSNLYSMFAAIIGAVVVLWLYHARVGVDERRLCQQLGFGSSEGGCQLQ